MKKLVLAALAAAMAPVGAMAQMPTTPAPDAPIPIATFGQLPALQGPDISPDGKMLAAKIRHDGETYLAVIPADGSSGPSLVTRDGQFDERGDLRVVGWNWADEKNLLITIAGRENIQGQKYDATRVVGYNVDTRKTTPLGWRNAFLSAGNILWTSHEGDPRILISRFAAKGDTERMFQPEVVEVNVESGKQRVVEHPHRVIQNWYADGQGVVRMGSAFDRDSGKITVLYRPDGRSNFRTIVKQKSEKYEQPPVPQVFLSADRALAISRHEGFSAVYELDLNTMEFGERVFGVDGYDVASITSNRDGDTLESVLVYEEGANRYFMDDRLKAIQAMLNESFGNVSLVSADEKREKIVFRSGAPDQAGQYLLFDTVSGQTRLIGWINDGLKDMKLNPVKMIEYRSSDGHDIEAVLTLPRLKEARSLPLIVLPHGGPWARDNVQYDGWAQALAEWGYAVIQPNFRGSSGYGKEWEAASDGNWGTRMQDDLLDAITHLADQGIADPERVCIFGWSYGGYAASRAAQRDGEYYRCAISGAGVHDIPAMVSYDRDYLGKYGSSYIGDAASRLADVSPSLHADEVSIPILIVHGAKDQRVPVKQSREFVDRLEDAGKVEGRDFIYIEQERNTHHLPLEEDRIQLLEEMKKFLDRHNPA